MRRPDSPVVAPADPGTHERGPAVLHYRADIREIHVHQARIADQHRNALGGVEQDLVGLLQGLLERHVLADHRQQALVGHDDHRIHMLSHFREPDLGLPHPLPALEQEGLGDDPHGEGSHITRDLRDDRRGTGSGSAAHAARHEDQVGTLEHALYVIAVLLDGLASDLGPSARAEAAGQPLSDLHLCVGLVVEQCLGVGVHGNELDPRQVLVDHAIDGVPAPAADSNHFHAGVLRDRFFEFEDHGISLEEVL